MIEVKQETISKKNTVVQGATNVEILRERKALELLNNPPFIEQWDRLLANCPWATVFQSSAFVKSWYEVYQNKFPIILLTQFEDEQLTGLFSLTIDENGKIVGAGLDIAEYQVWIAHPEQGNQFIQKALVLLQKEFPKREIYLKYLPYQTPVEKFRESAGLEPSPIINSYKHPIMVPDGAQMENELKKKNKKEKINRLKRQGNLEFKKVESPEEFGDILGELCIQSDFRKGAMFNKSAFREDPLKAQFLQKLFDQKLLHTTLLKLDEEIIASNVGISNKKWVHLQGINTHSPMQAKHSPGILHFLMLGKLLDEENIQYFDLTPGSDGYKDGLASEYLEAYDLRVCSNGKKIQHNIKANLQESLKSILLKLGIGQYKRKQLIKDLILAKQRGKLIIKNGLPCLFNQIFSRRAIQSDLKLNQLEANKFSTKINSNHLGDLLLYQPVGNYLPKWQFLMDAMNKLEFGYQAFTYSEGNQLLYSIWFIPDKTKKFTHKSHKEGPCLVDLYQHPTANNLEDFIQAVGNQIYTTQKIKNINRAYYSAR